MLPPPATLETGLLGHPQGPFPPPQPPAQDSARLPSQQFYPLPLLHSLGNGASVALGYQIPLINLAIDDARPLAPTAPLPPPLLIVGVSEVAPLAEANRLATTNVYRTLNVKDALLYLDQVKIKFYSQPDVYNDFLDIMKDFKLQLIDTPGVIDRVLTLFRGHPGLIQGFNTFLPPGYRIEISLDPQDPNPVRVITPTGTTTPATAAAASAAAAATTTPVLKQEEKPSVQPLPQPQQPQQPVLLAATTSEAAAASQVPGGQIEFNHAINYVNKIKTRFANQPDIYKQFLEILQTYQREQKPIGEVYEQVTVLFANLPDLLDDFKQFLPDTSNQAAQAQAPLAPQQQQQPVPQAQPQPAQPQPSQQPGFTQPQAHVANGYYVNNGQTQPLPPVGNFQQPLQGPPGEYHHGYQVATATAAVQPHLPEPKDDKKPVAGAVVVKPANPLLVPGVPEPMPLASQVKTLLLSEEISFFDKVKKAVGNKQTYNDFLKVINLFSMDIIDKPTLVERVEGFLGDLHPDLMQWFKMFIGYDEKPLHIEDITFKKHQLELSLCKAYGPLYRQLPKAETYMPCLGRDEMCWEVLNDEWVGHPTWALEDLGFIAHRKNQYEEILFKIEEERLEFDYFMEANLRTIQTLETIANRIANMTPEQKANFKLPPGLGTTLQTIYKKVIRKVYDKDRGFEVIDALHENPAIAVPVVLKRLKQKDEEWRRAQREWNKVWREMEQKVFYKSLDHLGLTFKQADKKLLTVKQLVLEISTVKVEQHNKRLHPLTPKPQEQLVYQFVDFDVVDDVLRLADVFITKLLNYLALDREKLVQFLRGFVDVFFGRDTTTEGVNGSSRKRSRDEPVLREVLKRTGKRDLPGLSPSSEDHDDTLEEVVDKLKELWIKTTAVNAARGSAPERRDRYNLFCNTAVYVFFRHLRTLYERLDEVKRMNADVAREIVLRKVPQFAKDLNLVCHQLEDQGVQIDGNEDCYQQVLSLLERLIEGEIEHQWFEELLRQGYRNRAYKCYTIDKVVQAMVKHAHLIVSDTKTLEMMCVWEQDRAQPVLLAKEQILYRMQVRHLMLPEENMFNIAYTPDTTTAAVTFVALDDLTIKDHTNVEEQYNYYVTLYIMAHPTEGVPASKLSMPFAKHVIDEVSDDQCEGHVTLGLKVLICPRLYRLFFDADTFDEFTANYVYSKSTAPPVDPEERIKQLLELVDAERENDDGDRLVQVLFNEGVEKYHEATRSEEEKHKQDQVDAENAELATQANEEAHHTEATASDVAKQPSTEPQQQPTEPQDATMEDALEVPQQAATAQQPELSEQAQPEPQEQVAEEHQQQERQLSAPAENEAQANASSAAVTESESANTGASAPQLATQENKSEPVSTEGDKMEVDGEGAPEASTTE
ncbi:hypothetical protein JNB11_00605 [Kocuria palustris]|nr:hypothetical protein [Kocuria palustris]